MFKMFDNIGNSIKWVAKILYWIAVIAGIICGSFCSTLGIQALFDEYGRDDAVWILFGLLIIALSPIAAWIICAPIYGFGEIIEKLSEISATSNSTLKIMQDVSKKIQEAVDAPQANINYNVTSNESLNNNTNANSTRNTKTESVSKKVADKQTKQPKIIKNELKSLYEILSYALRFQTDDGMIRYLQSIEKKQLQELLSLPSTQIRDRIASILSSQKHCEVVCGNCSERTTFLEIDADEQSSVVCPYCENKIHIDFDNQQNKPQTFYCPSCDSKITRNMNKCFTCGQKLDWK